VFDTPGLFDSPEKIVMSSDEKFMYVSNYKGTHADKCIKMDWQGTVVHTYEDQIYKYPKGIQELEDGTLLLCNRNSQIIERLSSSFKKCEIVDFEIGKYDYSNAVTYNEKDHKLFFSCSSSFSNRNNNMIKVFNVKWN
jgi:hypothetical protein